MTDEQVSPDVDADTDQSSETSGESDPAPDAERTAADAAADSSDRDPDSNVDVDVESADVDPDQDLTDRVENADPEMVAREIRALRERNEQLENRVDEQGETVEELQSDLKRKQAEFQNYKKRMEKRREQEQRRATEDLVGRLVDVRDNLKRGLDQEGDIREGVESTLRQFDEVLADENVEEIAPDPGQDVDPQRHEVLMRVDSDHPSGTVDQVHRSGYEMAEKVIRPAQITVSDDE
jgi:molecular chaperone GrpE